MHGSYEVINKDVHVLDRGPVVGREGLHLDWTSTILPGSLATVFLEFEAGGLVVSVDTLCRTLGSTSFLSLALLQAARSSSVWYSGEYKGTRNCLSTKSASVLVAVENVDGLCFHPMGRTRRITANFFKLAFVGHTTPNLGASPG